MRSFLRNALLRLGLVLGGLLAGVLLAELAARYLVEPVGREDLLFNAPAYSPLDLYINDPELLLLPNPGFEGEVATAEYRSFVRINEDSLRGPPLAPKPEGTLRLMAVGDSFTMSAQVEEEDLFQTLLAERLAAQLGRPVEILNGGVDGYGTLQELGRVEHLAEKAQLDGALFLFFLGNDITDNVTYNQLARGRRSEVPRPLDYKPGATPTMAGAPNHPPIPTWRVFLAQHSYLFAYWDVWQKSKDVDPRMLFRFKGELEIFLKDSGGLRMQMKDTRRAMALVGERCEARGLRCFVAIAPAAYMVEENRLENTFTMVGLDASRVDFQRATDAVLSAVPEGVPVLDLLPLLAPRADEDLYFTFDGHWSERGHAAVAEVLAEWMGPRLEEEGY
jgi:lysophospholipase L1-like esterase